MKKNQHQKKIPPKKAPAAIKKEFPLPAFLLLSFFAAIILSLIFFSPVLQNGFSNWDDPTYIENNPLIRDFTANNFKRIFSEIYFSNYQPLHIFSYFIEYRFFGLEPYGYHMVSIVMHAVVTMMVMWFVLLFTGKRNIACISGLLFVIHPMHVESVAWIAERKDLLYAFFMFASLIAYMYYIKNTSNLKNYLICFLMFALAIFSKTMAASLPPLLLLVDFYFKRKLNTRLVIEKVPYFILAIILGIVSVYASSRDGSINNNTTYLFFDRIILACSNLLMYVVKLIVPHNLSAFYPYPLKSAGMLPWYYYTSPVFILALLGAVLYSLKFNRIIFFSAAFFVLTVFLVLQLLPVGPTVFSERYSYIPSAALFMLFGYGADYLITLKSKEPFVKYAFYAMLGVYSIWLGVITIERCKVWKNPDTFWSDVISKFELVPIAYNNRGHYYNKTGRKEDAMADFNKAIGQNAEYDMALFNRGSLYGEMNKLKEALADLDKAIKINGKLGEAYKMRGQVYAMSGKNEQALADFNKALELNPDFPDIYYNLGIFYFNAGKQDEACRNFLKAVQLKDEKSKEMVRKYCTK